MDHVAKHIRHIKMGGFLLAIFGSSLSNSFCGIGMGVYLGALILEKGVFDPGKPLKPYPFKTLAMCLVATLCVSVLFSTHLWVSVKGFGKYVQGFLLLYAGLDLIEKKEDRKILLNVLLAVYALACLSALWQQFTGTDFLRGRTANIYRDDIRRLTGPFKHCNDFGVWLAAGFPIVIAGFMDARLHKETLRAAACAVLFAVLTVVMALTLSRSPILSAFVSVLIFSLFFSFRRFVIPALAVLLAVLWFVPSPLQERMHQIPTLSEGDIHERVLLLKTTLRMIDASPYFGLGLNTYSDNYPLFKPADYPAYMYSHNSFLQMASEIGWIGLLIFLAFTSAALLWPARAVIGAPERTARWLIAAFVAAGVGFLVNCLFDSALQSTQLRTLFWALLGSALGLARNGFLERGPAPYGHSAKH